MECSSEEFENLVEVLSILTYKSTSFCKYFHQQNGEIYLSSLSQKAFSHSISTQKNILYIYGNLQLDNKLIKLPLNIIFNKIFDKWQLDNTNTYTESINENAHYYFLFFWILSISSISK